MAAASPSSELLATRPQHRVRGKTPVSALTCAPRQRVHISPEECLAEPNFLACEDLALEAPGARKAVYLITFPALTRVVADGAGRHLTCPSTLSREDIARVVQDAFRKPVYADAGNSSRPTEVSLVSFVVFQERHAPSSGQAQGAVHYHVALKADATFRFAPRKRSIQENHGLASHWSTTHTGYWSAVRYGFFPSPKKAQTDLDPAPLTWSREGQHPPLFEASQEPMTSKALKRRREFKEMDAAAAGKKDPRASELDLVSVIVEQGFRNTPDDRHADKRLVEYLKAHGTPALVHLAFKLRARLSALIDDAWSWDQVSAQLAVSTKTRLECLREAWHSPCVCGGQWAETAMQCLCINEINPTWLCTDIYRLLRDGRREDRQVVVLSGRRGGEGKSFFLGPLRNVFPTDGVMETPQPGSFPLLGLELKKAVLLDEWSFDERVLPLAIQLLWYEGKPLLINRPQNRDYDGHLVYRGTAPIFVTCKEKELAPIEEQARIAMAAGSPSQHTMLLRRLRIYRFTQKFPETHGGYVPACKQCFANVVLQYNMDWP